MAKFKILHLYHDLMNLYGEWANADMLARALNASGIEAVIEKKSIGDSVDFKEYDFAYAGSGTERSQHACMRDLARRGAALLREIEAGLFFLATGNWHELFGRAVTMADGGRFEALGLLDFETARTSSRVTGDCVYTASFLPEKLIGFINRAGGCQNDLAAFERPFAPLIGPGASDGPRPSSEGIRYKNLLGTYLTGPILVRNPPLLSYYVNLLAGARGSAAKPPPLFEQQAAAYQAALGKLLRLPRGGR